MKPWHTGFNDYKNENVPCTHALSWIVTYIAMYIISIKTLIERQHLSIINFSQHTIQISSYYLKGFLANITMLKYTLLHIFRQVFFWAGNQGNHKNFDPSFSVLENNNSVCYHLKTKWTKPYQMWQFLKKNLIFGSSQQMIWHFLALLKFQNCVLMETTNSKP